MAESKSLEPTITVIGSCVIDNIIYTSRFPIIGESVVGSRILTQVGGKASNQAIAIARLEGNAQLVARVGSDEWARIAYKLWQDEGGNITNVLCDMNEPTERGNDVVDK